MITYKAYKNYIKKNHLYIAKLRQKVVDYPDNPDAKCWQGLILRTELLERDLKLKYPQYI